MKTLLSNELNPSLPKWQRPEKVAGAFVVVGAAGAGVYYWGQIVPYLVDIVFNSVKLGIGLGVLFGLFLLGTNRRIQTGLWYAGQRVFFDGVRIDNADRLGQRD